MALQYSGKLVTTGSVTGGDNNGLIDAIKTVLLDAGWSVVKPLYAQSFILNFTFPLAGDAIALIPQGGPQGFYQFYFDNQRDFVSQFTSSDVSCFDQLIGGPDKRVGITDNITTNILNITNSVGSSGYFSGSVVNSWRDLPQYPQFNGFGPIGIGTSTHPGGQGQRFSLFSTDGSWAQTAGPFGGGWVMRSQPDWQGGTTGLRIWSPRGNNVVIDILDAENNVYGFGDSTGFTATQSLDPSRGYRIAAGPFWMAVWSPYSTDLQTFIYHGLIYQNSFAAGVLGDPTPAVSYFSRSQVIDTAGQQYFISNIKKQPAVSGFGKEPFSFDQEFGNQRFVQPQIHFGGYAITNSRNCYGESDPLVGFGGAKLEFPKVQGQLYDALLIHGTIPLETSIVVDQHKFSCLVSQATTSSPEPFSPQAVSLFINLGLVQS